MNIPRHRKKILEMALPSAIRGMAVNAVLAVVKGVAGIIGHSYALTADAIESLTDVVSSGVVYFGIKVSVKPPDENHPYGHGKVEPLAALFVGLFLLIAAYTIAHESVTSLSSHSAPPAPFTLLVLLGVVAIKETLFRSVKQVGNRTESIALKSDAWHHRSDALTSLAAFIGISLALLGGPSFVNADKWAALAASIVIAFNAYHLARPAISELTDASPSDDIEQEVRLIAGSVPGVIALDKCYVRKMGFDYFVDLHVIVDGHTPVFEGHRIAHLVEDAIKKKNRKVVEVLVHIEPNFSSIN